MRRQSRLNAMTDTSTRTSRVVCNGLRATTGTYTLSMRCPVRSHLQQKGSDPTKHVGDKAPVVVDETGRPQLSNRLLCIAPRHSHGISDPLRRRTACSGCTKGVQADRVETNAQVVDRLYALLRSVLGIMASSHTFYILRLCATHL